MFFTSLLQNLYTPGSGVAEGLKRYTPSTEEKAFAGLSVGLVVVSTVINMWVTDRVFCKAYMMNIKNAFNVEKKGEARRRYIEGEEMTVSEQVIEDYQRDI